MYQSYHSTKWPIVPATIFTLRRGRLDTSGYSEGSGLPTASFEVFIELSIFSHLLRRGNGVRALNACPKFALLRLSNSSARPMRSVAEIGCNNLTSDESRL